MRAAAAAAILSALLTACGDDGAPAPGGVTASEAEALEEAASMLDERQLPPDTLPTEAAPAVPAPTPAVPAPTPAVPAPMPGDPPPAR